MAYSTRCKLVTVATGCLVAIAIALIVVFTMPGDGEPSTRAWETENRLPGTVVPSLYDILLHPDLDAANFTGESTTSRGACAAGILGSLNQLSWRGGYVAHSRLLSLSVSLQIPGNLGVWA